MRDRRTEQSGGLSLGDGTLLGRRAGLAASKRSRSDQVRAAANHSIHSLHGGSPTRHRSASADIDSVRFVDEIRTAMPMHGKATQQFHRTATERWGRKRVIQLC